MMTAVKATAKIKMINCSVIAMSSKNINKDTTIADLASWELMTGDPRNLLTPH